MRLPQELLDGIVLAIDDWTTLKSCSLVGSPLRGQSQRILLHSLTLGGDDCEKNTHARCILLDESPHIATYITDLTLHIPSPLSHDSVPDIQLILGTLDNVHRCRVIGGMSMPDNIRTFTSWPHLPLGLSSACLNFILRQPSLRQLTIENIIELPLDVGLSMIRAAPMLTAKGVGVIMVAEDSEIGVQHTSGLRRLSLESRCPSLYRLFIRPQHLSFTSGLTHLGIHTSNGNRGDGENAKLIFNAARTLQSLHIQTESASDRITSPLPAFPALRFLQYDLPILALGHPWFVENLRGFLAPESSPRLDGIIVIFHLGDGAAINDGNLNMLDAAIEAHPAHPYLGFRWHTDLSSRLPTRYLDTFVHMIHRAMPRAFTSGRLAIEHV